MITCWFLCQKLHICTYNQQKCSGDRPHFGAPWPLHCSTPKWRC